VRRSLLRSHCSLSSLQRTKERVPTRVEADARILRTSWKSRLRVKCHAEAGCTKSPCVTRISIGDLAECPRHCPSPLGGRRPPTRLGIRPSVTLCQTDGRAVADTQFLKSMIPHHAGAILMCDQSIEQLWITSYAISRRSHTEIVLPSRI
jgi:Domain of unknown function (DUF305)